MFSLDVIKNISSQNFFKKTNELKSKVKKLEYTSVLKSLKTHFVLGFAFNSSYIFLLYQFFIGGMSFSTSNICLIIFYLFFINMISNKLSDIINHFINKIHGINKISKIFIVKKYTAYSSKKIKELSKEINELDSESIRLMEEFIYIVDEKNIDNVNETTHRLLKNYINYSEDEDVINNKNKIIEISNNKLNNQQKCEIFKLVEKSIINEKERKNPIKESIGLEAENILKNINKLTVKKDKNIFIKNI
jgi:hypothetical protein